MRDNFRANITRERLWAYDPYAHALTTISEEHRLIHDGMGYTVTRKHAAVANEGVSDILLAVPAVTYPSSY
jgi:hypothetical protein